MTNLLSYNIQKYHVAEELINYIKTYYDTFEYYMKAGSSYTKPIKWTTGLIQGCPLSPILFIMVINYVLKYLNDKYQNDHGFSVKNGKVLFTAYVDDLCLICKDAASNEMIMKELSDILLTF